ncbi:MAG TPA: tyrosine--tRNA ligase [Candidatus Paceibacterota bacterium]
MKIITDKNKIEELLTRSIDTIYPTKEALREALLSGKQMRIYIGIDPTATYAHIGHSTNYIFLKKMHEMGHKVIALVGDFTAMLGDPSDKNETRERLSREQVEHNMRTFNNQIGKILPFNDQENPVEFRHNSEWLAGLSFEEVIDIASNFTVPQLLERDRFEKRLKENKTLYFHETFYPLMQGYDSVALDADIELGGTDQTFNMLAGRTLVKRYKNKEKFVVTTTLLINQKTGEKLMSKSQGTGVGLDLSANEMFSKCMSLADSGIKQVFVDCTYLPMENIDEIMKDIESRPFEVKKRMSLEVTAIYHGMKATKEAQKNFENTFSRGEAPTDIPKAKLSRLSDGILLADILLEQKLVASKNEFRRLIDEGAVSVDGVKIVNYHAPVCVGVYKIGKHRFLKII